MSSWYEEIPYGPLAQDTYERLGYIAYVSWGHGKDPEERKIIEIAEARGVSPHDYSQYQVKKLDSIIRPATPTGAENE